MAYPADLVSRIKGALRAGFGPKLVAHLTGIPLETVKEWSADNRRGEIVADHRVAEDIRDVLLDRFGGRESAR